MTPRVSVLVTTYNQERWIAEALESIVAQKTTAAFEVIVGDDASSDDTRRVAERVAAAHPAHIRILPAQSRMGMLANLQRCLREAHGEYVALLNGDDYWLSPQKIQRQVDALDRHPDWSMCFHRVRLVDEAGAMLAAHAGPGDRPVYRTRDLLGSANFVSTCSTMFRRALVGDFPVWFGSVPMGDWTLWLMLSLRGPLGYIDDTMAAYRIRPGSAWSGLSERDRLLWNIRFLTLADDYLGKRYASKVKRSVSNLYRLLGVEWLKAGDAGEAATAFRQAVTHNSLNVKAWRALMRIAVRP